MILAPGTVVDGRFRLIRELGEGGMGAVWLAHHEKLEMACAVKFIHADVAEVEGVRERFEREAKIAGQIKSPHVVQVLDYGVSGNVPYIAMEFLEGEDLSKRLDARGRLSPQEAVPIIAQIARALTKAHSAGLVHRDLKPENVFLVRDDDHEIVKVLDFGIAKAQTPLDAKTKTGALMGTPRFMSPEQAQGAKTLDHRSDLWSLGVIAYRCVVGVLPFDSDAIGDLMMRIIVHPLPIPSQVAPGLPASFDAWWLRAAARDPAQRFQSAKEMAETFALAFGLGASAGVGGATPIQNDSNPPYPSHHAYPSNPSPMPQMTPGRAFTPASSHPLPQGMVGAPTMIQEVGRSSSPSGPGLGHLPTAAQTLGPASRTYNAPLKKKSSSAAFVVAGIALVAGAGAAAIIIGAMSSNAAPIASPSPTGAATQPARVTADVVPSTAPKPIETVAPSPTPSVIPSGDADSDAQEAPPQPVAQKPGTRPRVVGHGPAPAPSPAPARSGKVRIRP